MITTCRKWKLAAFDVKIFRRRMIWRKNVNIRSLTRQQRKTWPMTEFARLNYGLLHDCCCCCCCCHLLSIFSFLLGFLLFDRCVSNYRLSFCFITMCIGFAMHWRSAGNLTFHCTLGYDLLLRLYILMLSCVISLWHMEFQAYDQNEWIVSIRALLLDC